MALPLTINTKLPPPPTLPHQTSLLPLPRTLSLDRSPFSFSVSSAAFEAAADGDGGEAAEASFYISKPVDPPPSPFSRSPSSATALQIPAV